MRQLNRLNQFSRAWLITHGQPLRCTVSELANHCFCSERHARNVLRLWEASGWVKWHAESGRGKRGLLTFLSSPEQLRSELLTKQLASGQSHTALQLSQLDPALLNQLLRPLMGGHWQNNTSTLRIPYYRPLDEWHPLRLTGRAEQHLAMQVFAGLTRFEHNRVIGDMAHHWRTSDDGLHWDFFLRPQLFWHNGERVDGEQLRQQLQRLFESAIGVPLLRSVRSITLPHPACLRFHLNQPDYWLAHRLASVAALLPHPDAPSRGCGPWKMVSFTAEKVRLENHSSYHLQHPLMQALEYWITPTLFLPELGTSCRHPVQIAIGQANELAQLQLVEQSISLGFCYLAIQQRRLNSQQSRYLIALIQRCNLVNQLEIDEDLITPSQSLLPGWPLPDLSAEPAVPLPPQLDLHYHLPIELAAMARHLQQMLRKQGCDLRLHFHPQKSWQGYSALDEADLVMGDRLIGEAPEYTLESWLRLDPLWPAMLSTTSRRDLLIQLQQIQAEPNESSRIAALRDLYSELMESSRMVPLFNYRYQVSAPPGVEGIHLNARGWFDFSRAWIPPPITR